MDVAPRFYKWMDGIGMGWVSPGGMQYRGPYGDDNHRRQCILKYRKSSFADGVL